MAMPVRTKPSISYASGLFAMALQRVYTTRSRFRADLLASIISILSNETMQSAALTLLAHGIFQFQKV